jgi:cbb3-type cytochrome oxidase maturation protein
LLKAAALHQAHGGIDNSFRCQPVDRSRFKAENVTRQMKRADLTPSVGEQLVAANRAVGKPLAPVVAAIDFSRNALQLMRQNLWLAVAYNLLAVPIAISGVVTPLVAAVAMSCSSLLVMVNALRARRVPHGYRDGSACDSRAFGACARLVGLLGFLWSLKSGQYEDLEGAAWRAIADDEPARQAPPD